MCRKKYGQYYEKQYKQYWSRCSGQTNHDSRCTKGYHNEVCICSTYHTSDCVERHVLVRLYWIGEKWYLLIIILHQSPHHILRLFVFFLLLHFNATALPSICLLFFHGVSLFLLMVFLFHFSWCFSMHSIRSEHTGLRVDG